MNVPFIDLNAYHRQISQHLREEFDSALDSGQFSIGDKGKRFESQFAKFCDTKMAVGCSSGTEALWLALKALGVGPGDEVITTPCTFIATSEAIVRAGATPVFVDVSPDTFNLDPNNLSAALSDKTKAIVPVHLFGQMADMDPIMDFAKAHGLYVIEDAAQAHGASYKGQRAGSIGQIGCFSFYPSKNLGALGDAGIATSNDRELIENMRSLRNHGQISTYDYTEIGWNSRLDEIQAAFLSVKLRDLESQNRQRVEAAAKYRDRLANCSGISVPVVKSPDDHIYHIFSVQAPQRDQIIEDMNNHGVQCRSHYPTPLHKIPAIARVSKIVGHLKVAEKCASRFLSLPMFPSITESQIDRVSETLIQVSSRREPTSAATSQS